MQDDDRAGGVGAADDLTLIAEAAQEAGRIAMGFFGRDPKVWNKENNSPVTEADMALDAFLGNELRAARPDYGWLSEETTDDMMRLERERLFVVDPIDGTRAFIHGEEDWSVSVAIVEAGRPVAAALYVPVPGELYLATAGGGAQLNGGAIAVSGRSELAGAHIAGPRSLRGQKALAAAGLDQDVHIRSLALRIALVAAGRRDGAIATRHANDWDLAAADLLVQEAGGQLTDLEGRTLRYNRPDVRHPVLVATSSALRVSLSEIVRSVLE